jgi:hypothetical protein
VVNASDTQVNVIACQRMEITSRPNAKWDTTTLTDHTGSRHGWQR